MKTKLETLETRKIENDRRIVELQEKVKGLEADHRAAVNAANTAAENGSIDEYAAKKRAADEIEAALFVSRTVLEKKQTYPGASKEEAAEAWNEFYKTESKTLAKNREAFDRALKEAKARFDEMIAEERKAYAVRHRCGELCGFRHNEKPDFINTLPMSELSVPALRPYIDFLRQTGVLSSEAIRDVYVTLNTHGF